MLRFPAGVHDDQVDALGLIGQMLDWIRPGVAPKAPPKPKDSLSGYKATRATSGSWRVKFTIRNGVLCPTSPGTTEDE